MDSLRIRYPSFQTVYLTIGIFLIPILFVFWLELSLFHKHYSIDISIIAREFGATFGLIIICAIFIFFQIIIIFLRQKTFCFNRNTQMCEIIYLTKKKKKILFKDIRLKSAKELIKVGTPGHQGTIYRLRLYEGSKEYIISDSIFRKKIEKLENKVHEILKIKFV